MDALDLEILFLIQNDARVAKCLRGRETRINRVGRSCPDQAPGEPVFDLSLWPPVLGPQASGITCTLNGCEWIPLAITIMS